MSKTTQELEDFAYNLGEHCLKFNTHVHYKEFVKGLVLEMAKDLKQDQLFDLVKFVDRLATSRQKEEKSGNINYYIKRKVGNSDNEGEDSDVDDMADFM